ncbi:hypothetical protein C0993_008344 [Termitomyces sp. T159_Od127]|nr:hypothetical protein C0993_008344 [Termitomyces sp. T159_Od127]
MAVPTDPYALLEFHMINGTIMSNLDLPPKDDVENFLGYCEVWALIVMTHHATEEQIIFPFLTQHMDFSGEKGQHEIIHTHLDKILSKIAEGKADPTKFDAVALKDIMAEAKEILYSHLDAEVEHISTANLKAAKFEGSDLKAMIDRMETYAKAHGDPYLILPFVRRSGDHLAMTYISILMFIHQSYSCRAEGRLALHALDSP